MKNRDLYINHQEKRKPDFTPLVDFLIALIMCGAIATIFICIPYL